VVGIVDTNNSVEGVDYIIPGNDDAIRAIKLYVEAAAKAIYTGRMSVAHAVADSSDEFIELDESGATKPARKKATARKKPASKVTVKSKTSAKKAAPETEAVDEAAAELPVPESAEAAAEEAGKE
jgi:small subunit ribosomal protein S2